MLAEASGLGADDLIRLGALVRERVSCDWPELDAELAGMADGADTELELLWAINARTELLGGIGECSLIGRLDGARAGVAQNWDWHPDLAPSRIVWTVEHDGTWFTTVTEAGMLGKIGLNGSGIACGLNFLSSSIDGGVDGVPVHVLLRLVLEAGSLADAMALLMRARVSASSCITLAGAEADGAGLVAVELSPAGAALVWPDADGVLVHTNHFRGGLRDAVDLEPAERPGTLLRQRRLESLVREGAADEVALGSHYPRPAPVCRHDADSDATAWVDRRATLLSVVIDPSVPSLRLAPGPPCVEPFVSVPLP